MAETNVSAEKSTQPRSFREAGGLAAYVLNSSYVDTGIQKAPLHSKIQLNIFRKSNSLLMLLLCKHKPEIYETSAVLKAKYAIKRYKNH